MTKKAEIHDRLYPDKFTKSISDVPARSAAAVVILTKHSKAKKAAGLLAGLEELDINRTAAQKILKELRMVVAGHLTAHTLPSFDDNVDAVLAAMIEKYDQIEPLIKNLLEVRDEPRKILAIDKQLLQILPH